MFKVLDDYIDSNVFEPEECEKLDLPCVNIIFEDLPPIDLFDFDYISKNMDELQCFMRIYDYLSNEFNKYYMTYTRSTNKVYDIELKKLFSSYTTQEKESSNLNAFGELISVPSNLNKPLKKPDASNYQNNRNSHSNKLCYFIKYLYYKCLNSISFINTDLSPYSKNVKIEKKNEINNYGKKIINLIIHSLYNIQKIDKNRKITKITINLFSVICIAEQWLWNIDTPIENHTRLLRLIMSELNEFGLEYCKPPNYNFIYFKKTEYDLTEYDVQFLKENPDLIEINEEKQHTTLDIPVVKRMNEVYTNQSKIFASFNNQITLMWKGLKKSIDGIFKSLQFSISDPMFVFAFAGILYKYAIAVVYYNTAMILEYDDTNSMNYFKHLLLKKEFLSPNRFPRHFETYIEELNSQLYIYVNSDQPQSLGNVLTPLKPVFEMLGIDVQLSKDTVSPLQDPSLQDDSSQQCLNLYKLYINTLDNYENKFNCILTNIHKLVKDVNEVL